MDFDEMLIHVGEFGIYQKALFLFQAPFCMFVTFILFGQLFMTLNPRNIWCQDHFNCTIGNISSEQRQNLSFAYTLGVLNPCFIHNLDFSRESGESDWKRGIDLWDVAFVKAIVDWTSGGPQGNRNYDENNVRFAKLGDEVNCARYQFGLLRNTSEEAACGGSSETRGRAGRQHGPEGEGWNNRLYIGTKDDGGIQGSLGEDDTWRSNQGPDIGGWDDGGSGQGPNGRTGNGPFWPGDLEDPSIASSRKGKLDAGICSLNISVAMTNASIFLIERLDTDRCPRRDRRFLPVTACKNVTWDRFTNPKTDVPYATIVTDGKWWCNAETYNTISTAIFFVGAIVGGFLIGWIADSFGRVPALVVANLLGAVGGALSVSTTNIYAFSFFRFITGMAFDNCFTMMYILVLEFCGPTYRTLVANLSIAVFYTFGTIMLPLLAQWIGNWQIYGLVISLPMLLGVFAIFLVPESARWLLSKGRTAEATKILRSFAKVNRKQVSESVFVDFEQNAQELFDYMKDSEEKEETLSAALRTPRLRRTFILLTLIWSFIALVYDGHSRNILNLANEEWSVFIMFMIASMTEFPADIMLIFTLDRFGRRWLSFGALTLSGAASIIAAAVPEENFTATLVLAMVARFFVNVSFNIGLQYAAELLPTVIRAQGVTAIHITGYVASIISPFIAMIGRTNRALSLILLGGFSIAAGFLSLFLAETLGEDLPNTLEEAETFGRKQSFWNCPFCATTRKEYEKPPAPAPAPAAEEDSVVRRSKLRLSITGAIYRSSMICHAAPRGSIMPGHHAEFFNHLALRRHSSREELIV